jgi:large subunit ribosomal protein L19
MKQRVEEMEREAKKLRELQAAAENSTAVEHPEGEEGVPMETEDDKAIIDSRSVFVGNVSDKCPYFGPRLTLPARYRSIIVRQLKISRPTSKHAVRSTVSQSSVTNLQVTLKGKQPGHFASFSRNKLNSFHHRFAYVEFAEPEFIDPALALDNSLFYGRLIKVCVAVWV